MCSPHKGAPLWGHWDGRGCRKIVVRAQPSKDSSGEDQPHPIPRQGDMSGGNKARPGGGKVAKEGGRQAKGLEVAPEAFRGLWR